MSPRLRVAARLASAVVVAGAVGAAALDLTPAAAAALFPQYATQFDLRDSEWYWRRLAAIASAYPAQETIVLTAVTPHGSFRHAGYYLPQYRVYAIGDDTAGRLGHLFTAYGGRSDYQLEGLARSRPSLPLPAGTRYALLLDPEVARAAGPSSRMTVLRVTQRRSVQILHLTDVAALVFEGGRVRASPEAAGAR